METYRTESYVETRTARLLSRMECLPPSIQVVAQYQEEAHGIPLLRVSLQESCRLEFFQK